MEAINAANAAEKAWSDALGILYGKFAGDIRYLPDGKGLPGSHLRTLYDAKVAADRAMNAAFVKVRNE
jgi:hypothetical protein